MNEEADGFGIYMEEACDSLSGVWTAFRPLAIQNHMPQGSMSMPNLDAQILENDRLLPLSFSVQKAVAIPASWEQGLEFRVMSLEGWYAASDQMGGGNLYISQALDRREMHCFMEMKSEVWRQKTEV